jgi:polysaccharide export outer membrane protein
MKRYYRLIYIVAATVAFCSCGSNRNIAYFQDLEKYEYLKGEISTSGSAGNSPIKPNDELSIVVSSIEPAGAAPFNSPNGAPYTVDSKGEIVIPTLGRIKLGGLSVEDASELLREHLKAYIIDPIVNVRISNFTISVLGAVNAPGTVPVSNGRMSILEAIAAAHDLTLHARRDNVLLVRTDGNKKEFVRFDLTKSNDVFSSDYFYLRQNDIIYVEPNKDIQQDAGMSQRKQFNLTLITTGLTAVISAISLIVAVSKN